MKKIFTFLSLCLLSITASAQEYVFTDAQGNTYDDGVVINRTEVEDDGFGGINLPGNLFVKNVGAAEGCEVAIVAEITKIDNGDLQLCFPTNCHNQSEVGTYETNEKANLAIGEAKDLQTEWIPAEFGECIVTYTAKKYQGFSSTGEDVRTITVKYKYSNAQQNWWGYVNGNESFNGVGVNSADTYHCAIFIPGNHSVAGGKTIHAVRFGLVSPNAKDAKVWIAKSKPTTINATNCLQVVDVPQSALGSLNIEVPLNEPYAIPAEGVYVGYSFTISKVQYSADGYPILLEPESSSSNTLLIKADNGVTRVLISVICSCTFYLKAIRLQIIS